MDKNDILEKIKKEATPDNDEMTKAVNTRSYRFALLFLLTYAMIIIITKVIRGDTEDIDIITSICTSYIAGQYLYTYIKLKKKFDLFLTILGFVVTIIGFLKFVL